MPAKFPLTITRPGWAYIDWLAMVRLDSDNSRQDAGWNWFPTGGYYQHPKTQAFPRVDRDGAASAGLADGNYLLRVIEAGALDLPTIPGGIRHPGARINLTVTGGKPSVSSFQLMPWKPIAPIFPKGQVVTFKVYASDLNHPLAGAEVSVQWRSPPAGTVFEIYNGVTPGNGILSAFVNYPGWPDVPGYNRCSVEVSKAGYVTKEVEEDAIDVTSPTLTIILVPV